VAVFETVPRFGQVVRDLAHVFHAPGDDHVAQAQHDALSAEHNGFHARGADFVDGGAGHRIGQTCKEGSLPGWRLSEVAGANIAHKDFFHQFRGNARFLQGAFDGRGAKLRGGNIGQRTAETADWRANGGGDIDFFHG